MIKEVIIYTILFIILLVMVVLLYSMLKGKQDPFENKKHLFAKPIQKAQSEKTKKVMTLEKSLEKTADNNIVIIENVEVDQSENELEKEQLDVKQILIEVEGVRLVDEGLNELNLEMPKIIKSSEADLPKQIVSGKEVEEEINLDELSSIF